VLDLNECQFLIAEGSDKTMSYILGLLLTASQSFGVDSCVERARADYDIIRAVTFGQSNVEIDTALRDLKALAKTGCFTRDDISYDSVLFDPRTGTVGSIAESYRVGYWESRYDYLNVLAAKGTPAELSREKSKIMSQFNTVKPAEISSETISSIQMMPAKERAQNCGTVDNIIPKLPPVRDQGASGWCYFYATADLMSFNTGKNISPSYLGHLMSPTGSGAGNADAVNNTIKRFGLCSEKSMPSDGIDSAYVDELTKLNDRVVQIKTSQSGACPVTSGLLTRFPGQVADIAKSMLGNVSSDGVIADFQITSRINEDTPTFTTPSIVQSMAVVQCTQDRDKLNDLVNKVQVTELRSNVSQKEKFDKIESELSAGKPINFTYDYNKLTGKPGDGAHWSTVVGRRMIDGVCQYQVRNSWGASSCTKVVSSKDACEPPGYFWVTGGQLFNNVNGVQYGAN